MSNEKTISSDGPLLTGPSSLPLTAIHLSPDAPLWVLVILQLVADGRDLRVYLDNDSQHGYDETGYEWDADAKPDPPRLDLPESPREMVEDLFRALGVKAAGV